MTPRQLYEREPQFISYDLNLLWQFGFLNNLEETYYAYWRIEPNVIDLNKKIEIKVLKEFNFDHKRYWRLSTVWFNNKPVMIIRNAGKHGCDHKSFFITDGNLYIQMLDYFKSLLPIEYKVEKIYGIDYDIENLDDFYDNKLDGYFEKF